MMTRAERIQNILNEGLSPVHMLLEDESHMHSGPRTETHFKLLIVSADFEGLSCVDRQRKVMGLLEAEFKAGLHALTQRALTPNEWSQMGATAGFVSPTCLGGSKHQKG